MSKREQAQTEQAVQAVQTYTKEELIEGAATLKAERFEVAGALFDCHQPITLEEAKKRLDAYRKREGV